MEDKSIIDDVINGNSFYCQKKCGEIDFSIDEWNRAQQELKTLTPEQLDFVMQPESICHKQCNSCDTIVLETRSKNATKELERAGYNVDELVKDGVNLINKLKQIRNEKANQKGI